jgi:predicted HicB family RNase H-like nuclease
MDQDRAESSVKKLNLRLTPEDHRQLKQAAADGCRSLHMEIIARLRRSFSVPAAAAAA